MDCKKIFRKSGPVCVKMKEKRISHTLQTYIHQEHFYGVIHGQLQNTNVSLLFSIFFTVFKSILPPLIPPFCSFLQFPSTVFSIIFSKIMTLFILDE